MYIGLNEVQYEIRLMATLVTVSVVPYPTCTLVLGYAIPVFSAVY
jgi:hypothetical protein